MLGDLGDLSSLKRALEGIEVPANIASIGFGHAPTIVRAAMESVIRRAVLVSAIAIFTTLKASSKTIRMDAEETIRRSDLAQAYHDLR